MRKGCCKVWLRRIGLLAVLVFVVWLGLRQGRVLLRAAAIARLAEFAGGRVTAESVDFGFDGTVVFVQPALRPAAEAVSGTAVLQAERLAVRFAWGSLLLFRPRVREVVLENFVFNAEQDVQTGRWNLEGLSIKPVGSRRGRTMVIRLRNGTLQYRRVLRGHDEAVVRLVVNGQLRPAEQTPGGWSFSATAVRAGATGQSSIVGLWRQGRVVVGGGISSADIQGLAGSWAVGRFSAELGYDRTGPFTLDLKLEDCVSSYSDQVDLSGFGVAGGQEAPEPLASLVRVYQRYRPSGQVDIELSASGNFGRGRDSKVTGRVFCEGLSICDRRFPYRIESLIGRIDFTADSISVEELSGRHGPVEFLIGGWSKDFGARRRYAFAVRSKNMLLDQNLYRALSTRQKQLWSAFDISQDSIASIDYRVSRNAQAVKARRLVVDLADAAVTYKAFPYRLSHLRGRLVFEADRVKISNLISESEGRRVIISGQASHPDGEELSYDLAIEANNIPLDAGLRQAMPDRQRRFYDRFDVEGTVDAKVQVFRQAGPDGHNGFRADVSPNKVVIKRVQGLEVDVPDVRGNLIFTPDCLQIKQIRGRHCGGEISVTGQVRAGQKPGHICYDLSVEGQAVQLGEELFNVLPVPLKEAVAALGPEGKINYHAKLQRGDDASEDTYQVEVECLGNRVESGRFGYPLEGVTGRVVATKKHEGVSVRLEDILGRVANRVEVTPGASEVRFNGEILLPAGRAEFTVSAKDILLDERLAIALGPAIGTAYRRLSPTGRLDVELATLRIYPAAGGGRRVEFSGPLQLKDCTAAGSDTITAAEARLLLNGLYETGAGLRHCRVGLSAGRLRIGGRQLKNVQADFHFDVDGRRWWTDDLVADFYGGRLSGRLGLEPDENGRYVYELRSGFEGVDLKRFMADLFSGGKQTNGYSRGRMAGSLSLRGSLAGGAESFGRCRLEITDMQVGRLSPLAKLLYVLQLTRPEDFAFDQIVVDGYVRGKGVFIEKLDMSGEQLAFNGSGWVDLFTRQVNLVLTARGQRLARAEPSVLQSLTDVLGSGVVRIDVTGNLYDPQIEKTALPLLEEGLKILGTERIEPQR